LADKPRQFFQEYRTVDRVYRAAKATANRERGLYCLERLAEGETITIDRGSAGMLGITLADLGSPALRTPVLREYAIAALGKLGGPDVVSYLSGKTKASMTKDSGENLWPAVQASLQEARLSLIKDPRAAEDFLDETLKGSMGAVATWAVNETCDRGLAASLPLVRESVRKRDHSSRADTTVKFCEDKVRLLSRDGDRLRALELALYPDNQESSPDLIRWVISQLAEEGSAGAQRAIDRFVASVLSAPRSSIKWQEFGGVVQEVEELRLAHVR
jgi:hypothetical protein